MTCFAIRTAAFTALCVPVGWAQNAPAVHSPEVAEDRRVTFRLAAPDARSVTVSGEFLKGDGATSEELFARDLIGDVIPLIESRYRADASREQRAIVGLSMGGGESLSIGLNHLELFAYVGGFSAGLRPAEFDKTFAATAADPRAPNEKLRLLWIGCGKDDAAMVNSKAFDEFLNEHNVHHMFRQSEGAHNWMVWRQYLNDVAQLLFR